MNATPARSLAALGALFALVACGGGSSGGLGGGPSAPPPPPPATVDSAVLSIGLAGGASPGIDHLWVTVTGVALHADATRVYGDGDSGWVVAMLAAPITVDLADPLLSRGRSVSLLKSSIARLGSYQQLRLLVASSDPNATLAASASAQSLVFNDQVQYTDSGGTHVVPLEIPDLQRGLRLLVPFTLGADTTTPLAIEWNAQSSLVRRKAVAGGADRFTIRNELHLYNQQLLTVFGDASMQIDGSIFDSISGQLDTSDFCTASKPTACIHDVVASATSLSQDGRFHAEVRSVNVGADGSFLLYPLPSDSAYDVVIHGGNMETIVVRNVFVDPTGLVKPFPTALSSTTSPLVPVLDARERRITLQNALVPASGRVFFGQTIAGSGDGADVPYVLATGAADPLTGELAGSLALPAGPLHSAVFDATKQGTGVAPVLTTTWPAEGAEAFSVWTQGTLGTGTSASTALAAAAGSVAAPAAVALAGLGSGTLEVTLAGTPTNGADHAELIVSNDGGSASVVDVSAMIATRGGSVAVTLTSGLSAAAPAATIYGVALRTWQAGAETTTARWSRTGRPVDLSSATSAKVALTLP